MFIQTYIFHVLGFLIFNLPMPHEDCDSQRERHASCSTKRAKTQKKKYQDGQLDKSLSAQAAQHSWSPWSDTFLIAARSFAWKQFGYRLRWLQWHSGRDLREGNPRGDPWDPMGSTSYHRPCVGMYAYTRVCGPLARGPVGWSHSADAFTTPISRYYTPRWLPR